MNAPSVHLDPAAGIVCADDDHCVTCSDAADPLRVVCVDPTRELAVCEDQHGTGCDRHGDEEERSALGGVISFHRRVHWLAAGSFARASGSA